jgi:peptidylprolyl isomerase
MRPALVVFAGLIAASAQAQTPPAPAAPTPAATAPAVPEWRPVDPANTLILETTKGRIVIEMRPDIAPNHVARMKALTRQGYYNGTQFYRVIKDFMAQAGDKGQKQFRSALPNLKREFEFTKTPALPYASLGTSPVGDMGFVGSVPVQIDPGGIKGFVKFCPGVGAFAHGAVEPDSANSQFFLMRGRATNLERTFSAWGRVIVGREVVEALKDGEPVVNPDTVTRARVMADIPAAQRPDIQVMDTRSPAFAALFAAALQAKPQGFTLCDVEVPVKAPGPQTP